MVHGYVLRTASGSLATPEREVADEEIEEIDTGEYNPNFQHCHRGRVVVPPPPPSPAVAATEDGGRGRGGNERTAMRPAQQQSLGHARAGVGEPRQGGVHRRLEFGTPEGALQAAETLLRHPPVTLGKGSITKRWLEDVARLDALALVETLGAVVKLAKDLPSGGADPLLCDSGRDAAEVDGVPLHDGVFKNLIELLPPALQVLQLLLSDEALDPGCGRQLRAPLGNLDLATRHHDLPSRQGLDLRLEPL
uniref:Uncharacterized protein n=1 Tax=Leersia perrieri TaxID=77586 RepID=A0A0D9X633_9ORYZ